VLNIQPDGTLALKEKVRGRDAAYKLMIEQLRRSMNADTVLDTVVITHTDCEADANKLSEMVKAELKVSNIEILMMGPVIGAHLGPGAVTLVLDADITRTEYEEKYYGGK
jgi:fatty acid-binding protein DegV